MKRNATTVAVAACLLLGALYFLQREDRVSVGMKELSLPKFDIKKIDRVLFSGKSDVILQKEGDGWKVILSEKEGVRSVPASNEGIDAMLNALTGLKPQRQVSERADLAASYGLDEKEGLHVQLFEAKDKMLDLWIGKSDEAGGRYIRLANANDIYDSQGAFYQIVKSDAKSWREKKLVSLKPDEIKRIEVSEPGAPSIYLAFDDQSKLWGYDQAKGKLAADFRFDSDRASDYARGLSNLVAFDFVEDVQSKEKANKAFEVPHAVVKLHGDKDAREIAIAKLSGDGEKFYARVKGDAQLYELSKYVFDEATRKLDYFRNMKLISLDPSKVKRIRLVSSKSDVISEKSDKEWVLKKPAILPKDMVWDADYASKVPDRLCSLHATRIVHVIPSAAGLASENTAKARIELEDEAGKKEILLFGNLLKPGKGKEGADEVYVRSPIDGQIYVLPAGVLKNVESGFEYFRQPAAHAGGQPGQDGLQNLPPEIRRQIEAAMRQQGQH
jgi:hypothetical protein